MPPSRPSRRRSSSSCATARGRPASPGTGAVDLPAENWYPYSPRTFVTPPFPGFPSGHSTVSGACSKVLELFTGSDKFGSVEFRKAGDLTEPGFACELMQAIDGKPYH